MGDGRTSRLKYWRRLASRRFRDKEKVFLVEGVRSVEEAFASGWRVEEVIYCPSLLKGERAQKLVERAAGEGLLVEAGERDFLEMAGTVTPQGVLALVRRRDFTLADVGRAPCPALLVVVDGVQDPGNLGTIIRSADAAGAGGVLILKGTADAFNPKTLRATMGSIFHLPVIQDLLPGEVIDFLAGMGVKILAGVPEGGKNLWECDLRGPCAVAVGSEASGISGEIMAGADEAVSIPMPGGAESLNAAVSAAIILYEAVRQRWARGI